MEIDIENSGSASQFKVLSVPGTPQPLQPISLERQNQQRIPQSPSLLSNLDGHGSPPKSHHHRLSDAADVRARIAYLNAISHPNSPTRPTSPLKPNNAALQRAMLGREEKESNTATHIALMEAYKARERAELEKIDTLLKQLDEVGNRRSHERGIYEREIKTVKKAEFKAGLAVIKLQEELRQVRGELESYKARSDHEKAEKEKARQEAFERAYVVAGMTEEVQDLKRRLEVAGQERDAAVAMAASKMVVEEKPAENEMKDDQQVGRKRRRMMTDLKMQYFDEEELRDPACPLEIKHAALQVEVDWLRRKIKEAEETFDFMQIQCQFKCCPCRVAERKGERFVHDHEYDAKTRAKHAERRETEDLEPLLPLPKLISYIAKQKQREVDGEQPMYLGGKPADQIIPKPHEELLEDATLLPGDAVSVEPENTMEEPAAPLPPAENPAEAATKAEEHSALAEPASIPLPSSRSMEIDTTDDTPEPTAQLEEFTQVIVEPGPSGQDFLFSTSTMSNKAVCEPAPNSQPVHSVRMSDDLFDISPPKRHMPPRPSTSMGFLTVDSPIRLVPHSPQVYKQRSMTPDVDTIRPTTTRVALNDISPVRQVRQQRHQGKPHNKDRTIGRSTTPVTPTESDTTSSVHSAHSATTPALNSERNHRQHRHMRPRPQSTQDHYPPSKRGISTTTTVPLRDNSENLLLNPSAPEHSHPHTQDYSSNASSTPFSVPGTPSMTREQALAQIRARRDRARSVNMRKSAEPGGVDAAGAKTPGSVARRGVNLKDRIIGAEGGKSRDFSQASAPGRI